MKFWALNVDILTALFLIVATGLAVDYASHITHCFVVIKDSPRNDRMKQTVIEMGPAVFNGGFSTFLAVVLLASSTCKVVIVFVRVFSLVVVFGLYNGLVLLPVMLSLIGPQSIATGIT